MIKTFISYLVLYGLQSNIIAGNGAGVLQFQREKRYRSFRYLSALFLILGILLCSVITYVLHNYVYSKFDLYFVSVSVSVLFVCVYNIIISNIWKKISSFKFYLYENSFSYAMDVAFTLSVIFTLDMSLPILDFAMSVLACIIVVIVMNAVIGFFVEGFNRSYLNKNFRNVSSRLFLFAIISILLYYASLMAV